MKEQHSTEEELTRRERKVGEAIARRDVATLDRWFADDFLAIVPGGVELTKAQALAQITAPGYELEFLRNEDIRVRVFGDVAIATARGVARGRLQGQETTGEFRYTRVWLRRDGRWQAVAAHSCMLK